MKKLALLATLVFSVMFLSPNVVLSETMEDLVEREGLTYKKFTDVPFTGKITGNRQGSFKNGEKEGPWVSYWSNGQLESKGNYKNGLREGPRVGYHLNGTVDKRVTGTYKNGKKISD